MPSLILLKSPGGTQAGHTYPLTGTATVTVGRDTQCQVFIDNNSVSRRHAVISQVDGKYYVEDQGSRNGTYVNQARADGRTALKSEDRIKICDFLFRFYDETARGPGLGLLPPTPRPEPEEADEDVTTVRQTTTQAAARQFLDAQPSERMRALLDISTRLSRTLELEPLLPQIVDTLFGLFRQADRCFVILLDEQGRMIPKVARSHRQNSTGEGLRYSKTIVRKCLDSLQSYLSEDASNDTALAAAQSIAEFRIRSVMCVPLVSADNKPLGAIQLDAQDLNKKFRDDDLKLLTIVANLAAASVEKAQLHASLVERENERREVEIARKVQVGFLPKTFPALPGYEFFAYYSPAQSVGGDYYDFVTLPSGRVAVVVADVAGKGVSAALLMAKLSAEVRYCMLTEPDVASAINLLNDQLIEGGVGDRFVTLACLVIDPILHEVTVVNAGHMNPIRCANGTLADLITSDESGFPLGLVPGNAYTAKTVPIAAGETVVVFTDGVTDAESPDEARFRADGLAAAVRSGTDGRPRGVGKRVVDAVNRHAAGRAQSDDIALVCFGRLDVGGQSDSVPLGYAPDADRPDSALSGPRTQLQPRPKPPTHAGDADS